MAQPTRARPNVVLITCHDLGTTLGCYGAPDVRTPHADRLAAEGVLLEDLYAAGVLASPSRGSLLTGCYPHTHRLLGPMPRGWLLEVDRCPPLPRLLADAGYETHLFGFQHEHVEAAALGYGHAHGLPAYYAEDVAQAFADWLSARPASGGPFFASLSPWEAHRLGLNPSHYARDPYTPPGPSEVVVPAYLPDLPAVRAEWVGFLGAVEHADRLVGRALAALEAAGLAANTLVVLTTDNGPSMMHAKGTLYDAGVHLACVWRWPEGLPAGRRLPGLASQVDVLPTLLEILGLPAPGAAGWRSLVAAMHGAGGGLREAVYAERNYDTGLQPSRMARTRRWKYVRRAAARCIYDEVIQELELSGTTFRAAPEMFAFYSARRTLEELYDLEADPAELCNLAEDVGHAAALEEMRRLLDAHLAETADPFRDLRLALPFDPDSYVKVRAATRAG
jgi:N-sulfoglucosamine sulfohydrolase